MKSPKFLKSALCILVTATVFSGSQASALLLPDPFDPLDGIEPALAVDDYVNYSILFLEQLQDNGFLPVAEYGDWNFSAGTGTLALKVATQGNVANPWTFTDPVNSASPDDFEDAADVPTGGTDPNTGAVWGLGVQPNGPNTVGEILEFLHFENPANNTPVFLFDMNQTKDEGTDTLYVSAQVSIIRDSNTIESWSLDAEQYIPGAPDYPNPNGVFNNNYPMLVPGGEHFCSDYTDPPCLPGQNEYDLNYNAGGGQADFAGYFPTMNLSNYLPSDLFVVQVFLADLNNGPETVFLSGNIAPFDNTDPIPEPATMLLLGTGLVGVAGAARRRKKNQA